MKDKVLTYEEVIFYTDSLVQSLLIDEAINILTQSEYGTIFGRNDQQRERESNEIIFPKLMFTNKI